jgi:serine/threonine protein kinase
LPEAGIKFGQYVLLRRIARGGMAEVFLAQQRGLEGFDRRVAVKRILPHLVDSPDFVKMFLGEAKLAAQLTHPNVVHIYDFGKVEGDYFIAMEFVDGVHAGQLFRLGERTNPRPERLTPTLVARIGADAAAALHYAHELRGPNGKPLNLVHRDVSPANLMVSFDGVVKLCDFGIAKAAALSDQLTNPGQVKGKYAYMSPEQTVAAPLDGRSDVFSLAIVLWELLAGRTIVGRNDTVEAMRAIRDGKLEPLDKVAPDTPRPLVDALQWALETRRDKRATAADLAQALEAFIKSSPEIATSMQLASWLRPRVPREATGEHAPVTGAQPVGTAAGPGTLAVPGTASSTPVPRPSLPASPSERDGSRQLIAASRMVSQDDHEDNAETVSLGTPSEIRAAIAARRNPVQTPAAARGGPSVVVERGPRAQTPRATRADDGDPASSYEDTRDSNLGDSGLRDTTYDPPGETDRTVRREREDFADDDDNNDIVDTFERGSKLREMMTKRAPSVTEMPRVVHAMFSEPRGSDARDRNRTDYVEPTSRPGRDWETPPEDGRDDGARGDPTFAEPSNRLPGARRKLPEPTRPPAARAPAARSDVLAVPVAAAQAADRSAPIVVAPVAPAADRSAPVAMVAPAGVGSSAHPRLPPVGGEPARRPATQTLRRGPRLAIAIFVLVVLGAISFLIALRTRGHRVELPPQHDAARTEEVKPVVTPADPGSGSSADAGSGAAAAKVTALLEVSTTPPGATVKVGDQTRASPTRFALAAGQYTITAELAGFETETREVELLDNEHVVKEIALTHRTTPVAAIGAGTVAGPTGAKQTGFLSARTQPYADVYDGGRLLGQTPLADVAMSPGVYTLTFRNPGKAAVKRQVTITAGKTTKLQFDL